ncbi:MAG: AAA family ATPase [Gammaproteobacteria bacterium]|nr:AAA family ATPase [Gammaproteobacteria bacterium]
MSLDTKYRPLAFEEIVGNTNTIRKIATSLDEPEHSRAIFLSGPTGVGKTTCARCIARKKFGLEPKEDLKSMLNYNEIDASTDRGIDTIRNIKGALLYRSFDSRPRLYFIDECSFLTPDAQAALLKIIEDAPGDVYFILATTEPQKIRKDLRGRCSRHNFVELTEDETVGLMKSIAIKEGRLVGEDTLLEIAKRSCGQPRKAIIIMEEIIHLPVDEQKASLRNEDQPPPEKPVKPLKVKPPKAGTTVYKGTTPAPTSVFKHTPDSERYLKQLKATLIPFEKLRKKPFLPPKMFIFPFLSEGALIMLYAEPGAGKTYFLMLIASILTRAGDEQYQIGPLQLHNKCAIVILDGELIEYQFVGKLSSVSDPFGPASIDHPIMTGINNEFSHKYGGSIDLANEGWRAAIYSIFEENPEYKVLILDNLTSLCWGFNENSKESWDIINHFLLSLKRLKVAVILVHHSNRAGGYSGHSAQTRNLDTTICMEKLGSNTDEIHFRIKYEKTRDAKRGEAQGFVLKAGKHPDNPKWIAWEHEDDDAAEQDDKDSDDQIMVAVMQKEMTQREIAKAFGVSQPKVSNCKRQAIDRGFLSETKEITEAGAEFIRKFDLKQED